MEAVQFHAYDKLCQCQMMTGDTAGSKKSCTEAIRIDDQPRLYCERAEAYLAEDMYDEAISDYRAALERDEGFSRAKDGMAKAQKLQKQVQLNYPMLDFSSALVLKLCEIEKAGC